MTTKIYAMTNPSMPGLVKIGYSHDPEERAAELYTTGVATRFVVEYQETVKDGRRIEGLLHERFAKHRENEDREFFRVSVRAVKWAMWKLWFRGKY